MRTPRRNRHALLRPRRQPDPAGVARCLPAGDPLNVLYNSQTGKSVAYSADTTETDDFAVPGDFGSITARFTGKIVSVTLPGGGLILHDVGVFTFAPNDVIAEDHGPKMLFFGQTEELCAALA